MTDTISFSLDGRIVSASTTDSLFDVAKREGIKIPHLCHLDGQNYSASGNCRACMVEIEGERILAASCMRKPMANMIVRTSGARVEKSRTMVFELLQSQMPQRDNAPDPKAKFWHWSDQLNVNGSRLPKSRSARVDPKAAGLSLHDHSHQAIAVNLDACITCGLCERACREVQVNDVIGMAYRGIHARPVFDLDDAMGASTCVSCGECVQVCPTGALLEKSIMEATATQQNRTVEHWVNSVCPYCGVGCQTSLGIADNHIVQVDGRHGPANQSRLCVKGRFGLDYIHHPHRLTKPLIRRQDAPKRGDEILNPANPLTHFREANWQEALLVAAHGLQHNAKLHGGNSIAGFGSAKGSNEEAYLFQKLIRQGFGTNNVDHCTRLCHASSVAALLEGVGSAAVSAPFTAAQEADCIIVIGSRPTENHPVAATYFKQAAKAGAHLIVMDPRGNPLARHARYFLRFRPGADVALLQSLLHVIIDEELYNAEYIRTHVDGFDELAASVRAATPEVMASLSGIAPETIRSVARLYATAKRSIIFWGMGVSQHVHGTDNARCLIALALITGHIGRPGTGLHPLRGQNNVQGASDAGLIPMMYPDYRLVEQETYRLDFERKWGRSLDHKKGLTVIEVMDAIHEGKIRAMYIMGENPAMSDPDQIHARAALAKLDHLVVQDIFLTETAWHADVVLPASAHPEKLGTFTNSNRQVQIGRPAVTPPGDAKPDLDIIFSLANQLGLDWQYPSVSAVYEEMRSVMPSLHGLPWDRLEAEDAVTYPARDAKTPGDALLFSGAFPTPSGRAKLRPVSLQPPDELPDDAYPLVLTTGRLLEHWHTGSMSRRSTILSELEPGAIAVMHPREIRRLGYAPGNLADIETRRGKIRVMLREDRDMPDGMVFIPFAFNEGAANRLTNPALDPFGKIPELKFCAAKIASAV